MEIFIKPNNDITNCDIKNKLTKNYEIKEFDKFGLTSYVSAKMIYDFLKFVRNRKLLLTHIKISIFDNESKKHTTRKFTSFEQFVSFFNERYSTTKINDDTCYFENIIYLSEFNVNSLVFENNYEFDIKTTKKDIFTIKHKNKINAHRNDLITREIESINSTIKINYRAYIDTYNKVFTIFSQKKIDDMLKIKDYLIQETTLFPYKNFEL